MTRKWTSLLLVLTLLALPTGCFGDGETTSSAGAVSSVSSEEASWEETSSEQIPDNTLTDAEILAILMDEETMSNSRNLAMKGTTKEILDSDGFKMTTTTKGVLYSLEFEDGYEYYMESEYLGKTYVMCYREDRLYTMRKTGDDYDGYSEEMSRDEFFEEYWTATDVSITASMLKEATVVREGDKLTVTYEGVSQAFGNALLSTTGEWQDLVEEEEEASFTVTACSFELVIEKGIRKTATMSATGDITDEEGKVLSTISVNSENEYMDYGPDADFEVPLPDNLSQLPDYEEYWEDQDDGLIGL